MKIAISGSGGFIGYHLINALRSQKNVELITIDKATGIDLTNKKNIEKISRFDVFIHLAGLSYVPFSFKQPEQFYRINFVSTLNALELCRKFSAKMIFISSYVYGQPKYLPIDESHPIDAFNPYSQSKIICEKLCEGYFRDFNVPTIVLRPFNIYGDKQNIHFLIPGILKQIKNGRSIIKIKDANPRRDFIHVTDLVRAIIMCTTSKNLTFEIFNVASSESYSVKEVAEIIKSLIKDKYSVDFQFDELDIRKNEVNETRGSYDKIQNSLGWSPSLSFVEGLENMILKELKN
jgi:UDP-glucose 4-epimerase